MECRFTDLGTQGWRKRTDPAKKWDFFWAIWVRRERSPGLPIARTGHWQHRGRPCAAHAAPGASGAAHAARAGHSSHLLHLKAKEDEITRGPDPGPKILKF